MLVSEVILDLIKIDLFAYSELGFIFGPWFAGVVVSSLVWPWEFGPQQPFQKVATLNVRAFFSDVDSTFTFNKGQLAAWLTAS